MIDGKRYTIKCEDMNLPHSHWTKEGSAAIANQYFATVTVDSRRNFLIESANRAAAGPKLPYAVEDVLDHMNVVASLLREDSRPSKPDRDTGKQLDAFLEFHRGSMKPQTYLEVSTSLPCGVILPHCSLML
jgi:hypothetical protein